MTKPRLPIPINASIEAIDAAYNTFMLEFVEFRRQFTNQRYILWHSGGNFLTEKKDMYIVESIEKDIENIAEVFLKWETCALLDGTPVMLNEHINRTLPLELPHVYVEKTGEKKTYSPDALRIEINALMDTHTKLITDVAQLEQKLPMKQFCILYLFKAVGFLDKLCTAVTNFLRGVSPNKAARNSLITPMGEAKIATNEKKALQAALDKLIEATKEAELKGVIRPQ